MAILVYGREDFSDNSSCEAIARNGRGAIEFFLLFRAQ